MFRWLVLISVSGITVVVATVAGLALYDRQEKYPKAEIAVEVPALSAIDIGFEHNFKRLRGVPYAAGAIIDIDRDGNDEIFLGGGVRQPDGLFRFDKGRFIDLSDQIGLVKQGDGVTTGAAVFDVDANGYSDLVVSREGGIWLYKNDGGSLALQKLDIDFSEKEVPLGVSITDLNRDGHFDFFVPVVERGEADNWFLLKETKKQTLAKLYVNNGDDTFFDITDSVGLQYSGGALQAVFTDLDEDGLQDMTVLYTDGTLKTWKNLGNLLFENKHHSMSSLKGDFMGLGVGDYNGDGRTDFLLTNRGTTISDFAAKLISRYRQVRERQWILMKNMGFFSYHDEAPRAELGRYELGRGALFSDLNGDGRMDLVVSQNHPYWPAHMFQQLRLPNRILLQGNKGKFHQADTLKGLAGRQLGVAPLQGDINGDNRPDLVLINLDGRSRVLFNSPGSNHFLKVVLPDSPKSLGAKVTVKTLSGDTMVRPFLVSKVLCSDSSHAIFFGLGKGKATDVMVDYQDGKKDQTSGVLYNTAIIFD